MARRTSVRTAALLGAAAACLSSGCALSRMVQAAFPSSPVVYESSEFAALKDKSPAAVPDNKTTAARPAATGVQQASATDATPPATLPQPTAVPTPPPVTVPVPPGPVGPQNPAPPDPHTRGTPTAAGAALGLQPWESPLDKAVELARKIDACTADNKALLARIRQLEANAEQREQAVGESVREVEAASEQLIRTRADVQALRKEIAALRAKVAQVEKEDADTLRAVIAALERLIEQEVNP